MKYFLLFLLCLSQSIFAQQEKTFKHLIQKEETLASIAKKYNVSPAEIIKLNPGVEKGIQENTSILIPNKNSISYIFKKNDVASVAYTKHVVGPKETLFSIARDFNVSVKDLDELNAENLKDGLKIGQEILLPNKKKTLNGQARVINNETIFHVVQPKETKYSISKQYGITIEQLELQNPETINGLVEGTKLAINKNGIKSKSENDELMIALAEKQAMQEKAKVQTAKIEDLEDRLKVQKELNRKMITLNKLNINLNAIDESKSGSVEKLRLIVDANKKIQDLLLWKLDSLANTMEADLADLKNKNIETLEESKKLERESYQRIAETNQLVLQLKQDIAENRKIFVNAMHKVQRLTIQENQEYKKKVRENLSNKDIASIEEMNKINQAQTNLDKKNDVLLSKIDAIDTEKKEVLKRKIARASFYSAEARQYDDRLAQVKLERYQNSVAETVAKQENTPSHEEINKVLSENVIDEKTMTKIEVIRNLKNMDNGFYLVAKIFADTTERDDFAKKLTDSGEIKTSFFYNINNFMYYVYTKKFATANEAIYEYKNKLGKEMFDSVFIVQIEKEQ